VKVQDWIFSVRYWHPQQDGDLPPIERLAVVGPARASTVETALHLARVPEERRAEIRSNALVCDFVDGKLDPTKSGYYIDSPPRSEHSWRSQPSWAICIGSVHEVLDR
jgi:hypothetical protein